MKKKSDWPQQAEKETLDIKNALSRLGVAASICYVNKGPTVVRAALCIPRGVKYSQITKIVDKLRCELKVLSLRIEAPIPGSKLVGIEFPRTDPEEVKFADFCIDEYYARRSRMVATPMFLPVVIGEDVDGQVITCDLASSPHILIGGAPGQGSPEFLHNIICRLVSSRTPEDAQFILIDPRRGELSPYEKLPNLAMPIVNNARSVVFALHWAVAEMEKRLKMFTRARTRNIADFNSRDPKASKSDMLGFGDDATTLGLPATLPYIVIVINDFDEVMERCGKEILPGIQRLAAKARAAGIHLVLKTERPDKKVFPGTLLANIPVRVAFRTVSVKDSKVILDDAGAESLIGNGDALMRGNDGTIRRVQTPCISVEEIAAIVENAVNAATDRKFADDMLRKDYRLAYEAVVETQQASIAHLQRCLGWGYNRAAEIFDELTKNGVVSKQNGAKPRMVLVNTLLEPQSSEVVMKVRLSLDELKALRRLAKARHCEAGDIVSSFVHERLEQDAKMV